MSKSEASSSATQARKVSVSEWNGTSRIDRKWLVQDWKNQRTESTPGAFWSNSDSPQLEEELERIKTNDPSIDTLTLSNCNMGTGEVEMLTSALNENDKITVLNLSYNKLGFRQIKHLVEHLQDNYSIKTFKIWKNNLGDRGAIEMLPLLTHSCFMNVNLGDNGIGPEGAEAIAQAIAQDCSICNLTLNNNPIGDAGAICIAEALSSNTHLEKLNLSGTGIGEAGARALAIAIQNNHSYVTAMGEMKIVQCSVKSLNLWGCRIEGKGAAVLSDTLHKKNNALTHLKIGGFFPTRICVQ